MVVIGWESNTASPGLSTIELLPDSCPLSEASSSSSSSLVTTNVEEPKPICTVSD
ncbi:unnamed protein product, partial [Timema podura]|nr:unnamed protein product [Timema podura]